MSLHTVSGAEGEAIGQDTDRYRDPTGRLQRTRISEAAMVQTSRLPNPGFKSLAPSLQQESLHPLSNMLAGPAWAPGNIRA
jgi:hypothetical protein